MADFFSFDFGSPTTPECFVKTEDPQTLFLYKFAATHCGFVVIVVLLLVVAGVQSVNRVVLLVVVIHPGGRAWEPPRPAGLGIPPRRGGGRRGRHGGAARVLVKGAAASEPTYGIKNVQKSGRTCEPPNV